MTRQNQIQSTEYPAKVRTGSARGTRKPAEVKQDGLTLLKEDHKKVKLLFKDFEKAMKVENDDADKDELVARICAELKLHAEMEEEIVYPQARLAGIDTEIMDEADVEHEGAKKLIVQLAFMKPGESHYDAKVKVLGEYVKHHIKEEEEEMFPLIKQAGIDTAALGRKIINYKRQKTTN